MENNITKSRLEELEKYYNQTSYLRRYYTVYTYTQILKTQIEELEELIKKEEHGIDISFILKHQNALNEMLKIASGEYGIYIDDWGEMYEYELINLTR